MNRVVALAFVSVCACDPPDTAPRWQATGESVPRRGGTLHISFQQSVATLDPSYGYDENSFYALRLLGETLVDYPAGSTTLVPRLAERWDVSADAKTFRFILRDARFSDGTPVTAADMKYSLERARTTPDSPFGYLVSDVVGIETPSEHELVIRLANPNVSFVYLLANTFAVPQRADHVARAGDQLRRKPLSNGPYELVEWSEGERMVFRRNPHYRGTQPAYLDEIIVFENVPRDTQFLMFEQGALDSIYRLSGPDLLWIRAQPAWAPYVRSRPTLNVFGARFDVTQKPFNDVRVRRAFNYALDRSHVEKLLLGTAIPSHGVLPPGTFGRDDKIVPYPHDPAKARALLAEAGYPNGLTVDFVTIADEEAEKLAASYQADLADAGITIRIQVVSFALYNALNGKRGQPAFAYEGWQGDSADAPSFIDAKFHSRAISDAGSMNDSYYANPRLDALLDAARADLDPISRAARYHEAEAILADDAPWLWVYHQADTELSQPYVKGVAPHPVWVRDFSETWLDVGPDGQRDEVDR